jgi:alkylated DNA repair dioxygenase AlkB
MSTWAIRVSGGSRPSGAAIVRIGASWRRPSLAGRLGLDDGPFVQALVNEYAPGAGIGWHRDRPVYGEIIGVSFIAPCVMRFRRKETAQWRLVGATLDPGSVYRLSGEARQDWQHSISPMTTLR